MDLQLPRAARLLSGTATPIYVVDPTTGLPIYTAATPVRVGALSGVIRNSSSSLYGFTVLNTNAAARFLQFYNKSTAGVPGTDTPIFTVPLGPGGSITVNLTSIIQFTTGCSYAVTTDWAGTTAGGGGTTSSAASSRLIPHSERSPLLPQRGTSFRPVLDPSQSHDGASLIQGFPDHHHAILAGHPAWRLPQVLLVRLDARARAPEPDTHPT